MVTSWQLVMYVFYRTTCFFCEIDPLTPYYSTGCILVVWKDKLVNSPLVLLRKMQGLGLKPFAFYEPKRTYQATHKKDYRIQRVQS